MEKLRTKVGKVGGVLLGGLLLGSGIFGAQHVQAHEKNDTLDNPSCTNACLTDEDLFYRKRYLVQITLRSSGHYKHNDIAPSLVKQQSRGQGTSTEKKGNTRTFSTPKLRSPQLAAGELRVFDTRTADADLGCDSLSEGKHDCDFPNELYQP